MDGEFGGNFISISDEEGNSYELEHLDTIELDGAYFLAFLPADVEEDSDDYGIVILKSVPGGDGEDYFEVPDDEEEEKVYELFMKRLFEEEN